MLARPAHIGRLLSLLFLSCAVFRLSPCSAHATTFTIEPYLQNGTQTAITVKWETDTSATSRVEWGTSLSFGRSVSSTTLVTRHRLRMTGLEPETYYHYRVLSGDAVSSPARFMTDPFRNTPFRCVVYGDNRDPLTMHSAVIASMLLDKPTMVAHVGDVCYDGSEVWRWKKEFFDHAKPMLRQAPFYVAIGNHDYTAGGYTHFAEYFETPSPISRGTYFAISYGNSRFIFLDSNWFTATQMTWLRNELQSEDYRAATWRFVILHHPPYSNALSGGESWQRTNLVPLLEQNGVDIIFGGHAHVYERGEKNGVLHVVTAGGGAELHPFIDYWDFLTLHEEFFHHCVLDVNGEHLRLQAIEHNRAVHDEFVMDKRGRPFAVHEEFAYPDGGFVGKNGGSGWSQTWQLESGTSPVVTDMQAEFTTAGRVARRFARSYGDGGTSCTYWVQAAIQSSGGGTSASAEIRLGDDLTFGHTAGRRLWCLTVGGRLYDSKAALDEQSHVLVLEIALSAKSKSDSVHLWVDPGDQNIRSRADLAVGNLDLPPLDKMTIQTSAGALTHVDDFVLTTRPLVLEGFARAGQWQLY